MSWNALRSARSSRRRLSHRPGRPYSNRWLCRSFVRRSPIRLLPLCRTSRCDCDTADDDRSGRSTDLAFDDADDSTEHCCSDHTGTRHHALDRMQPQCIGRHVRRHREFLLPLRVVRQTGPVRRPSFAGGTMVYRPSLRALLTELPQVSRDVPGKPQLSSRNMDSSYSIGPPGSIIRTIHNAVLPPWPVR